MTQTKGVPGSATVILRSDGIGDCGSVVKNAIQVALEIFLLDFANAEEALDDRWYHSALRELLYDNEGEITTWSFDSQEEAQSFIRDPYSRMNDYHDQIRKRFENMVFDNRESIDVAYMTLNITSVLSSFNKDNIVIIIGGNLV